MSNKIRVVTSVLVSLASLVLIICAIIFTTNSLDASYKHHTHTIDIGSQQVGNTNTYCPICGKNIK